jgi:FkbM family methyltransferase
MARLLQLARRVRTTVGGDAIWSALRPAYWAVVTRLSGDAGVSMRLADGHDYRLDPPLYAWRPERYEPEVVAALVATVNERSVVYDIGAHVGLVTLVAARRVCPGWGRVYAFEPSPDNFALLERHVRINRYNDRVSAFHCLVGERTAGSVRFACRPGQFTANSLAYDVPGGEAVHVPMTSIDDMVRSGSLPPADVIKIDVEGYERSVLQGARGLLRERAPVVICAMHPAPLAQLGTSADAIIAEMAGLGYRAFDLRRHEITTAGFEEVVFRKN